MRRQIYPVLITLLILPLILAACSGDPFGNGIGDGGGGDGDGDGDPSDCPTISISSVTPSVANSGENYTDFTISGLVFSGGPSLAVEILDGSDVVASGLSVVCEDISTVICDLDFNGVDPGEYTLMVTNGCSSLRTDTISYIVLPDIYKNIQLRDNAVGIADVGVHSEESQPWILFEDGELWRYYGKNYESGGFIANAPGMDRVSVIDFGEVAMGGTNSAVRTIYSPNLGLDTGNPIGTGCLDVFVTSEYDYHTFMYIHQNLIAFRIQDIAEHSNSWTAFYNGIGPGPLNINIDAVLAADTSADLPDNSTMWVYVLEGAPEFDVERIDCTFEPDLGGVFSFETDQSFLGMQGDGPYELNDPRDIACDDYSRVCILDVYSDGSPVVKMYDSDMVYLGEFGDDVMISGEPIRLEIDDSTCDVHVVHTDGVSVFPTE